MPDQILVLVAEDEELVRLIIVDAFPPLLRAA
jgi:hypothetical protein